MPPLKGGILRPKIGFPGVSGSFITRLYEARLSAADDEIREEKKQAQKDAAAAAQQQLDAARAEAEKIVSDAQAMAERSREKIVRQAGQDVKDLAAEATEKLVLQSGGDAFDQFLDLAEKEAQHEQS